MVTDGYGPTEKIDNIVELYQYQEEDIRDTLEYHVHLGFEYLLDSQGWPDHIEVEMVSDMCNQGTVDVGILDFVLQAHIDIALDMVDKKMWLACYNCT